MSEGTKQVIDLVAGKLQKWGFTPQNSRLLLACSGGKDSMLLWKILTLLNYQFDVAHVNYGLRDEDSDADALFVEQNAQSENRKCHVLDASEQMKNTVDRNIQSSARQIRYDWFSKLILQENYTAVLTAHHQEDQAETFLLQLLRGSGGKGLSGMNEVNEHVARPMLTVSAQAVDSALEDLEIVWRDDKSNESLKYRRNFVRALILPKMKLLNPEASNILAETCTRLKSEQNLLEFFIDQSGIILEKSLKTGLRIDKQKLLELPEPTLVLFHILGEWGFSWALCQQMAANLTKTKELTYQSGTSTARADRLHIAVYQDNTTVSQEEIGVVWELKVEVLTEVPDFVKENSNNMVFLSGSFLGCKLSLRNPRNADYFYPSGMVGRKKLSAFFKDIKLSSEEKKSQVLLCVDDEVAWIVNRRIDRRFEVKPEDKTVVQIQLIAQKGAKKAL
jgi:tRNA(Ile)-lysidine synthase